MCLQIRQCAFIISYYYCDFGEQDFFYVFPIVSLLELSVAMETSSDPTWPKP